jgi:coproporphyrinogen III oxidase-like Fe-S oxidoreductase
VRTENPASLPDYRRRIEKGSLPWENVHACSLDDAWKESLIAGLRMLEGIDIAEIGKRIGPPPESVRRAVESLLRAGKLREDGSRLRLQAGALFISNEALQALA